MALKAYGWKAFTLLLWVNVDQVKVAHEKELWLLNSEKE